MANLDFYYPFDSVSGDRKITAATERRFWAELFGDGVVSSDGFRLNTTATAGKFGIAAGVAIVGGCIGGTTAKYQMTAKPAAGTSGYIVIRTDTNNAARKMTLEFVTALQSATQAQLAEGGQRDLPLYKVTANTAGNAYTVTDVRKWANSFDKSKFSAQFDAMVASVQAQAETAFDAQADRFEAAISASEDATASATRASSAADAAKQNADSAATAANNAASAANAAKQKVDAAISNANAAASAANTAASSVNAAASAANTAASSANAAAAAANGASEDATAAAQNALNIVNSIASIEPPSDDEVQDLRDENATLATALVELQDGYIVLVETAYMPTNRRTALSIETVTVAQATVSGETATFN